MNNNTEDKSSDALTEKMSTSYKVTYFNGRGRGELTRLLLTAAGETFEDERISREQWPELKPKMPQAAIPVLTVDGKVLPQSGAINRYLARKFGLYGETNEDLTTNDIILETVADLRNALVKAHFEQNDETKAKLFETIKVKTVPNFVRYMEKLLCENDNGSSFFVGSKITIGDLALLDIMDIILELILPTALDEAPKLKAHRERVSKDDKIEQWLKNRPKTAM